MVISENTEYILRIKLEKYFELKQSSIGPLTIYVGAYACKVELDNRAKV